MIGAAILLALSVQTTAAPADAPAPAPIGVGALRDACVAGIGGDDSALARCVKAMTERAVALGTPDPATSPCMASDHGPSSQLVWNWLDWLKDHPAPDDADAGTSVTTSILTKWPCGWTEG
jgi:hypothetical protein